MHAVFRFLENDGLGAFKNFIRDLHAVNAELFINAFSDGGIKIMEGRKAMHKDALRPGLAHDFSGNTIGNQILDSFLPDGIRFTHGNPDICIDGVSAIHSAYIRGKFQGGAGFSGDGPAIGNQVLVRPVLFRRACDEVHTHFGTADHQGIPHVVAGVAKIYQFNPLQEAKMLPDRQKIGKDLGGMEFVGESVPGRNAGITGKIFNDLLPETAVFDPVAVSAMLSFFPIWLPEGSR